MYRTAAHRQDQINILFHIVLNDLHGMFICMKSLCIQCKDLAPVINIFHNFFRSLHCIGITDQKRRDMLFQEAVAHSLLQSVHSAFFYYDLLHVHMVFFPTPARSAKIIRIHSHIYYPPVLWHHTIIVWYYT